MAQIEVVNSLLQPQREVALPEEVFGVPYRQDLVYEAVRCYAANQRLGTHSTKRRDEVSGSGKKLWKQKHTGRARMGEIRSPLWYHGGIVFGPKPRDYSYTIPRKVRRGAMRTLLAERLRRGVLKVVDSLAFEGAKTKEFITKFGALMEAHKTALFVDEKISCSIFLACRNIPGVKVTGLDEINVYDLARYEVVIFSEPALLKLAEVLKP